MEARGSKAKASVPKTNMREVVFIINPNANGGGAGKQWKNQKFIERAKTYFVPKAVHLTECFTTKPGDAELLARVHAQDLGESATIVAVGGDGTLNEVINGIMQAVDDGKHIGALPALAVLPMGTGCDFARHYGWKPGDLDSVLERIFKEDTERIDVLQGVMAGSGKKRYFVNIGSIGLAGGAANVVERCKWMGNALAYPAAVARAFFSHNRNLDLKLRIDDGEWQTFTNLTLLVCANGSYFGNGFNIAPDGNPSNGYISVVLGRGFSLWDFIMKARLLKVGAHYDLEGVHVWAGKKVEFSVTKGADLVAEDALVELDGDVVGAGGGVVTLNPGVIRLVL